MYSMVYAVGNNRLYCENTCRQAGLHDCVFFINVVVSIHVENRNCYIRVTRCVLIIDLNNKIYGRKSSYYKKIKTYKAAVV